MGDGTAAGPMAYGQWPNRHVCPEESSLLLDERLRRLGRPRNKCDSLAAASWSSARSGGAEAGDGLVTEFVKPGGSRT